MERKHNIKRGLTTSKSVAIFIFTTLYCINASQAPALDDDEIKKKRWRTVGRTLVSEDNDILRHFSGDWYIDEDGEKHRVRLMNDHLLFGKGPPGGLQSWPIEFSAYNP